MVCVLFVCASVCACLLRLCVLFVNCCVVVYGVWCLCFCPGVWSNCACERCVCDVLCDVIWLAVVCYVLCWCVCSVQMYSCAFYVICCVRLYVID